MEQKDWKSDETHSQMRQERESRAVVKKTNIRRYIEKVINGKTEKIIGKCKTIWRKYVYTKKRMSAVKGVENKSITVFTNCNEFFGQTIKIWTGKDNFNEIGDIFIECRSI